MYILLLLLITTHHLTRSQPISGDLLGSGGGTGYLYTADIPKNEQGVISFASTQYTVHENHATALITVTRTCNEAQQTLCAGEVSVAYSTETIPNIPLPGTFSVTIGSNKIAPTDDLRDLVFKSDQIRIPWEQHRLDPVLSAFHSVTNANYQQIITMEQRYGASGLRAYHRRARTKLPGVNEHNITLGDNFIQTGRDLRETISRGDVVRVGYERFTVDMSANREFNATHLPLNNIFQGYYPKGKLTCNNIRNIQNEWILTIPSQSITELAGVTVTQGSFSVGTLKTALSSQWTMEIAAQSITATQGVIVSQNEWILTIAAQDITASVDVAVTQGFITGTLKTALTGAGMTTVVITTATGNTFVTTTDVVIGVGGTAITVALTNINAATNSISATGTLQTALNGATTNVIIDTISGVSFVNTADLIIGSTTVANANVNTATNNGATTVVTIESAAGTIFDTSVGIVIGTTTVNTVNTATKTESLTSVLLIEWKLMVASQKITENAGVSVTQGDATGTLKTAFQNEWTLSITAQSITQSAGVTITQTVLGVTVSGTLKTALTGSTTNIVILAASGIAFVDTATVVVGGVEVLADNVLTATNSAEWTMNIASQNINEIQGIAVLQNAWTMGITSQSITENKGVTVSQNEWTVTIAAQTITKDAGVTVTQGASTGILKTTLTGADMTSVVISTNAGVTFVNGVELSIDSGGTPAIVVLGNVNAATNSQTATGTLMTTLSGATTNVIISTAANSMTFVTTADLVIGSTTVVLANVNTAIQATGTLKTALTGASTNVVVSANSGITFVNNADLLIGSTTVVLANINTATMNIGAATNLVIQTTSADIAFSSTADIIIGSDEWTLTITSQNIEETVNTAVSQNEWTLTVTEQTVTAIVGAIVTQGTSTGRLKTALTGTGMTTVIISAASGVSFVATSNVMIESTSIASASITAATNSVPSKSGSLKIALIGDTTTVIIQTLPGVTFVATSDILIGNTAIVHNSNIASSTQTKTATTVALTAIHTADNIKSSKTDTNVTVLKLVDYMTEYPNFYSITKTTITTVDLEIIDSSIVPSVTTSTITGPSITSQITNRIEGSCNDTFHDPSIVSGAYNGFACNAVSETVSNTDPDLNTGTILKY